MWENILNNKLFIAAMYLVSAFFINNILIGCAVRWIKKKVSAKSHYWTVINVIRTLFGAVIYAVTAVSIINLLFNINMSSVLAATGVVGVIVGFGAQNIFKDIINGFFILAEDHYKVGDLVKIGDFTGTVKDLTFRVTKIESFSGEMMIIPNGNISDIINLSKTTKQVFVDVPVSYEHDIKEIMPVIEKALPEEDDAYTGPPKILGVIELRENCYIVRVCLYTKPGEQFITERRVLENIRAEFKRNGIRHACLNIKESVR